MKKFLNVAEPRPQKDNTSNRSALATIGPGAAKLRVKDPFAVGIEEFERPFRFGPSRPSLKAQAANKNENRKNENANNINAKQKVHQQSDSVRLPGADHPASVVGRRLQQLGHQRRADAER